MKLTNWDLLYESMKACGYSERTLSVAAGRSHSWLHNLRKRNAEFRSSDVQKLCELLKFEDTRRTEVFFAADVE